MKLSNFPETSLSAAMKIPLLIHAMFAKFPYVRCMRTSILFRSLPITSGYFRYFRIIPVGNSYHIYIFYIYHSALIPPPEATPPCQTLICRFKAFISPQRLRHRRDAESSPADVLEPCGQSGVLRMSRRATQGKQYYHVGDLVMLLTVTGCYPLLFHHVGDLIREEFYLHTFLYFLCT